MYYEDITVNDTTYNSTDTIKIENIEITSTFNHTYTTLVIYLHERIREIITNHKQLIVEIFNVTATNNQPTMTQLKVGKIDSIKLANHKLIIEIAGITKSLAHATTRKYSSTCRACFGDMRCTLDKNDYLIQKHFSNRHYN